MHPALTRTARLLPIASAVALVSLSLAGSAHAAPQGPPSFEPGLLPVPQSVHRGLVAGSWVEPSTSVEGAMRALLYGGGNAAEFELVATVTEHYAINPAQRTGVISGQLYVAQVPTGIQVSGWWTIDTKTNQGVFDLDLHVSATPTAPAIAVGSVNGDLSDLLPRGSTEGSSVAASLPSMRSVSGLWMML